MATEYAIWLERAKATLKASSAELRALSGSAVAKGASIDRMAVAGVADDIAVIAGILGYGRLSAFAARLRESAANGIEAESAAIDRAASAIEECADALDPLPDGAEIINPARVAMRPPLSSRPSTREPEPESDLKTALDGVVLPFRSREDTEYALVVPAETLKKARKEGKRVSIVVAECADDPAQGPRDAIASVKSLAAKGTLVRYGALSMPESRMRENGFRLPAYFVLVTGESAVGACAAAGLSPKFEKTIFSPKPGKARAPDAAPETAPTCAVVASSVNPPETAVAPPEFPETAVIDLPEGVVLPDLASISARESLSDVVAHDFALPDTRPADAPERERVSITHERLEVESLEAEIEPPRKTPEVNTAKMAVSAEEGAIRSGDIKFPIALKMMAMTSLLFVVALSVMIYAATWFFQADATVRIEENNKSLADVMALKAEEDLKAVTEKAALFAREAGRGGADPFSGDREIAFTGLYAKDGEASPLESENASFAKERGFAPGRLSGMARAFSSGKARALGGETVVMNASEGATEPMLFVASPFKVDGKDGALVALVASTDRFQRTFRSGGITVAWLQDPEGNVLAHPDSAMVVSLASFKGEAMTAFIASSRLNNGQTRYESPGGAPGTREPWLGSFRRLSFGNASVIAAVPETRAFEAVSGIVRRNLYLALATVGLAVLAVWFYSKSLTRPIRRLVAAAGRIEAGDFLVSVDAPSRDELGLLARSFVKMGKGLDEREKIKASFGKFVNKEVAERAMRGELKLGGERKRATVFFSDIRGFTSISESLEPEEVVDFLNKYMTVMVRCVNATGGVVDKYIGDAIMAVWGTPVSRGNDAENAVNAALMMRKELARFNEGRGGGRKPVIRIGCGLNSGPLIAGQIGSEERMEYTVIGDTVNLASRIEALNKPFATDILISSETQAAVRDVFRVEPMKPIMVKGKAEPQQIYAVIGRLDDPSCPASLEEVRAGLGVGTVDLGTVDVEAAEQKYSIVEGGA